MREQIMLIPNSITLAKNGERVLSGYWYIEVRHKPGYAIVEVIPNQLSQEHELMVWETDKEGSEDASEYTFLAPVPPYRE